MGIKDYWFIECQDIITLSESEVKKKPRRHVNDSKLKGLVNNEAVEPKKVVPYLTKNICV